MQQQKQQISKTILQLPESINYNVGDSGAPIVETSAVKYGGMNDGEGISHIMIQTTFGVSTVTSGLS